MPLSAQCCAISFIENLDAQSLSLTQEEYNSYMTGKAVPPGTVPSEPICSGLRLMYANLTSLEELRGRQDRLMKSARELQAEMTAWKDSVVKQVSSHRVLYFKILESAINLVLVMRVVPGPSQQDSSKS